MLPLTKKQAHAAADWMKTNFGRQIGRAVKGTPFTVDHICGIACQETAYFWLSFINKLEPKEILARCVLDASGDFPNTHRSAFPKNTTAFKARYGEAFTAMLIAEANVSRKLRGFKPATWVYKGYGIFQYDLQFVVKDEDFFRRKQWYQFDACLDRVLKELTANHARSGDIWKSLRSYNGTGPAATAYANNVIQFASYAAEV